MSSYIVMRKAVLQEDEGREELLAVRESRQEAEAFIEKYTKNDTGYFKKADCYIATGRG